MAKYEFELREDGRVKNAAWDKAPKGYFRTDENGDGVFYIDWEKNSRSQLVGTCDFSVYGCTKETARRRIRNHRKEYYWWYADDDQ